jgi:hypothetical protein
VKTQTQKVLTQASAWVWEPKQPESKVEKVDHDFGFEFSTSKPEIKDNRLKPIQKVIQIDDDDDDFGLFSKPVPKSLAKPLGKPAIPTTKEPEKIVVNQENEEVKWSFECYEMFVKEEIEFCLNSLQGPQGRQIVDNKIPSSIKGMNMQKLLVNDSSNSNSRYESGSESESQNSSDSVNFDDNSDILP